MKKKWIISILIILLISGGWWYWRRIHATTDVATVTVMRGDIAETVSASMVLKAAEEITLNFEITGRIKDISVDEGDKVGAGDVLATVDSTELGELVARAKASLDRARASVSANDDAIREASQSEKDVKAYYEAVKESEDEKVSAANDAYDRAKDYERDAESYYNQIVADEGESSAMAKSAKLTLTTARNNVSSTDNARDMTRKTRDSIEQSAKNTWNATKERVKTLASSASTAIENSDIRFAEANYAIALADAEKGKLKAPVNGEVTKINYRMGEVIGTAMTAEGFGRLLSYDLLLEAKVPESDIVRVKLGQTASITFDSLDSDEAFDSEVIEIDPDATVIQDVVYYIVKLRLKTIDQRLKPGMSGDADIHIADKKNVLELPSRLIIEESDREFVTVVGLDGSKERREIETGLRGDEGMVEIVSGLFEGDRILSE